MNGQSCQKGDVHRAPSLTGSALIRQELTSEAVSRSGLEVVGQAVQLGSPMIGTEPEPLGDEVGAQLRTAVTRHMQLPARLAFGCLITYAISSLALCPFACMLRPVQWSAALSVYWPWQSDQDGRRRT